MSNKISEDVKIRMTFEMVEWLDQVCASTGVSRSKIIRSILQAAIDADRSAHAEDSCCVVGANAEHLGCR